MSVYVDDGCDELLPCPFCKPSHLLKHKADFDSPTIDVQCDSCGCCGPEATRKHTAEELWNARRIEL